MGQLFSLMVELTAYAPRSWPLIRVGNNGDIARVCMGISDELNNRREPVGARWILESKAQV